MQTEMIPVVARRTADDGRSIAPRVAVSIRAGTPGDLPFIDRLQKAQAREVGFLPTQAIEGKVRLGQVLIAEVAESGSCSVAELPAANTATLQQPNTATPPATPTPVGYLIAADRYQKRDEVGCVTQVNVVPEHRRSLVAAALLQAQFDRSAYGCRLYCCWCAQDLRANEFWEAMGFAPIAFRTGSRTKGKGGTARMHIFWQKRIRPGDVTTPWWYPSQTGGGELREDRLVFPIPPGVSWRDVLPVLPGGEGGAATGAGALPGAVRAKRVPKRLRAVKTRVRTRPRGPRMPGGLWFAHDTIDVLDRQDGREWVEVGEVGSPAVLAFEAEQERLRAAGGEAASSTALAASGKAESPARPAIDPRLLAMARELRDRWAERADLIAEPSAVHDVRRTLGAGRATATPAALVPDAARHLLPVAA